MRGKGCPDTHNNGRRPFLGRRYRVVRGPSRWGLETSRRRVGEEKAWGVRKNVTFLGVHVLPPVGTDVRV